MIKNKVILILLFLLLFVSSQLLNVGNFLIHRAMDAALTTSQQLNFFGMLVNYVFFFDLGIWMMFGSSIVLGISLISCVIVLFV